MKISGGTERRIFDLSDRLKVRVTGDDRARFLNGQITNDVRKATEANTIEACLLDAKGRMNGHIFLFATPDAFLLDADRAQEKSLGPRLERYLIADDVAIEDVSERWALFHVLGDAVPRKWAEHWVVSARRFNEPGLDVWIDSSQRESAWAELTKTFSACDEVCAEALRIEAGIGRWGRELTSEIIPVEANLEARCVDYEKGCYVGQEVVSRMKMSGRRNKMLGGLLAKSFGSLKPGMKLFAGPEPAREAGWITSVSPRQMAGQGQLALGFVKRGFNAVGALLEARGALGKGGGPVPVEVVDLPVVE